MLFLIRGDYMHLLSFQLWKPHPSPQYNNIFSMGFMLKSTWDKQEHRLLSLMLLVPLQMTMAGTPCAKVKKYILRNDSSKAMGLHKSMPGSCFLTCEPYCSL